MRPLQQRWYCCSNFSKPKLWLSQLLCKWASFKAGKLGISGQRKLHNKSLNIFHEIYIDLIWPNAYIFSYDVCSALHWLNNGVMLIHSGRWPLIIFSWADRETKSWCNFWAADWKKLKRNLNAHRPDLLVFFYPAENVLTTFGTNLSGNVACVSRGKAFPCTQAHSHWHVSMLLSNKTRTTHSMLAPHHLWKYWNILTFYFYVLKQRKLR